MKVLVTGVSGQLGHDVREELLRENAEVLAPSREEFDLTDMTQMYDYIEREKPDAVVHCAAYTAVDKAEEETFKCHDVNAAGTRTLAKNCGRLGIPIVYISTDYVFDGSGDEPHETDSRKGPLNEYGLSKLAGEEGIRCFCEKYFIIRTSWVFGVNGGNFVKTILRIAAAKDTITVVDDQIGSPTYTRDLAKLICEMIKTEKYGIYHATNEGFCSFCEFAQKIVELAGRRTRIIPIPSEKYHTPAKRPLNSRLSKQSLVDAGFSRLPDWEDALKRYMKDLREYELEKKNGKAAVHRSEKAEKTEKNEKTAKTEKTAKAENTEKSEKKVKTSAKDSKTAEEK